VFTDKYIYDENTNVKRIDDLVDGTTSREMGYDELDRLVSANAPLLWGSATFGYDPLDNLRFSAIGVRSYSHIYNATTNRLTSLSQNGGGSTNYTYDSRGNIVGRGADAFVFDRAGRLTAAIGKETYVYDGMRRRVARVTGRVWYATGKTNGTYSYRVRACDTAACGPYSPTATVFVTDQWPGPTKALRWMRRLNSVTRNCR